LRLHARDTSYTFFYPFGRLGNSSRLLILSCSLFTNSTLMSVAIGGSSSPPPERRRSQQSISASTGVHTLSADTRRAALIIRGRVPGLDSLANSLRALGIEPEAVESAADAMVRTSKRRFDFLLIHRDLPDIRSDMARLFQNMAPSVPVVLVGNDVALRLAVAAIRYDTSESTQTVAETPRPAADAPREHVAAPTDSSSRATSVPPRSAAERWARLVFKARQSEQDLRTLEQWAHFVGVSYSSLCESCRLVGVRPSDARNLVRVLGAMIGAASRRCPIEMLLDVSDRRTLKLLLAKAGFQTDRSPLSIEQFLVKQRFVPVDNQGLTVLRGLLSPNAAQTDGGRGEALVR
jgi:hypothetical protein